MATIQNYPVEKICKDNPIFSIIRTTVETAFYGNNVLHVQDLHQAYEKARQSPGTIVTDLAVYRPEKIGLPEDAKVLIFNDGSVTGRTAAARRISGIDEVKDADYAPILRDAVYDSRHKTMLHGQAYIGLDPDFMVKAHLLLPEHEENNLYSWLLNFQTVNDEYDAMYAKSHLLEKEGDIYIYADPTWAHPDFPMGLAYFDPTHNCACILGMRYFGELKKGTLTLAWGIAARNGYVSCHGGLKKFTSKTGGSYVAAVFGLSGSGKSTITHAKHNGKYDITVLHDDAFIIDIEKGTSIALEPAYFDKTQDYTSGSEDNKYLLTAQNIGATLDANGRIVPVTEDIRNGNGRAVKSRLWSPNRVDKIDEPINAIFWLMKDPVLPPIVKIENTALASALGATLSTKRTTAERLKKGVDMNSIVIEPYANPFRIYPLREDYIHFKELFDKGVDCYILNTGDFLGKKVTPAVTLSCIEAIVDKTAAFVPMGPLKGLQMTAIDGYTPDFSDPAYMAQMKNRMENRIEFLYLNNSNRSGFNFVPLEAINALEEVIQS